MKVFNALGTERSASNFQYTNANTSDIVTGAGTDTYLTGGSLGNISTRLAAGSNFKWRIRMSKATTGTTAPSFLIRYGTAGAVSDTARVTLAFTGTATAVADTAYVEVDAIVRSGGATGVLQGGARIDRTAAASTGFGGTAYQNVVGTSSSFDMTPAASVIGISCAPGTAAVVTFQIVSVEFNTTLTT